jgi:hypothetical protein
MFTAAMAQIKIAPAEGIIPTRYQPTRSFIMNAKEIKAALADEGVQAAVTKQVAVAVKAETKRVLAVVKEAELPEDKAAAKAAKEVIKAITASIKEAA